MIDLVKNFTIKQDAKIRKLCSPLETLFESPIFTYFSIDSEGEIVTLSNYPEQFNYYYSERLYLDNPYLVHPDLLRSGFVYTESTPEDKYLATLENSRETFPLFHPFLWLEKKEELVEGYFFATKKKTESPSSLYIPYLSTLQKFTRYFKRETEELRKKIELCGYNMKSEKGELFLTRSQGLPLGNEDRNIEKCLKMICPLSPRERQCLELLQKGHSARQIAILLGLAVKTVENYIDHLKDKLGCSSKWELLDK